MIAARPKANAWKNRRNSCKHFVPHSPRCARLARRFDMGELVLRTTAEHSRQIFQLISKIYIKSIEHSIKNRFKIDVKSSQHRSKICLKICPKLVSKSVQNLSQNRSKIDPKLVSKSVQNRSRWGTENRAL